MNGPRSALLEVRNRRVEFPTRRQITETILAHLPVSRREARERTIALLAEVGFLAPDRRLDHYPHQFSGGMRQRVVIELALCAQRELIIADETTTALEVPTQAQIITLLRRFYREHGAAVMLIAHDLTRRDCRNCRSRRCHVCRANG